MSKEITGKVTINNKTVTEFFNSDYTDFTKYVISSRACPSMMDGFKTGARKIMHAAFNGSIKGGSTVKLLNLSGDTLKLSLYAHGDASLNSTIITLAQDFNDNLNPLTIEGQYGSLRSPEASSPRYLYVRLNKYANLIYKTDIECVNYVFDEGETLEPHYYLPIIPTVLTSRGIGMAPGFRFSTMSYNPIDLIDNCIAVIKKGEPNKLTRPYVRGIKTYNWKFIIDEEKGTSYWENYGEWSYNKSRDIMIITDLPYDMTFDDFEKLLNKYLETGYIKDWKNFSTGDKINYSVQFEQGRLRKEIGQETADTHLPNKFKLIKRVPNDNLWVLDENGKVKNFFSTSELIKHFVEVRLEKYNDRKSRLVDILTKKYNENTDLCKFIKLVIEGKIKINNRPRAEIKEDLKQYNLKDSLLSVPISKLTKEEYEALLKENESIKKELEYIKNTTIEEMYLKDLKELRKELEPDFPEDENPHKEKFSGTYKEDTEKAKLAALKEAEKKAKAKEKEKVEKEKTKKQKEKEKAAKEKEKLAKQKEKERKAKEKEKLAKQKEKERKAKEKEKKLKEKEKLAKQKEKLAKLKKK
ncbi:MAG: hypothetical protein IJH39_08500 [Clostridia bacterium]|nr:hypothetical protein [Clostridia bacterium]